MLIDILIYSNSEVKYITNETKAS